jgi:hypothetical protein
MIKIRQWTAAVLLMSLFFSSIQVSSIQAQGYDDMDQEWTDEEACCPAYVQGTQSAHWSIYIPISLFVVAAVWLGLADSNHKNSCCSSYKYGCCDSSDGSCRDCCSESGCYRTLSSRSSCGCHCH